MLQSIREHTQGWIASVIIGIIILTFALWGIHSYFVGGGRSDVIAEVNGVNITKNQLSLAYERLRRQAQNNNANNALKNQGALKEQAFQALIETQVLKQASYAEGFRIFDAQIDSYLQSIPEFQVNGQFSLDRFQRVLSLSMLSADEFLNLIQTSLQIEQPKLGIIFSSFALPDEAANNIAIVNEERDLQYLILPMSYFLTQPIIITPLQIQQYYDDHRQMFKTNEQVSIEYLTLSQRDLMAGIHPTDAELRSYYNENIASYVGSTEGNKETKPKAFEDVAAKVRESYLMQRAEEKFADVRDQLSNMTYEHPDSLQYAAKTLNLPVKTSELFVKDAAGKDIAQYKKVRDAAFSNDVLNLNNNSDVIQIDSGTAVVLRIKSHVPSVVLPLKDVSEQIEEKLKNDAAEVRSEQAAKSLSQQLQNGANLNEVLNMQNASWKNAGFISRYNTSVETAILDLAFTLPPPQVGKISYGIAKLPKGYAIVGVKGVKVGSLDDKKQYTVFAEQVQNSEGLLEYELYKQSKLKQAKIQVND